MSIYQVTIHGKTYTVEIPNLNERPIRAIVNGEVVSVNVATPPTAYAASVPQSSAAAAFALSPVNTARAGAVKAPLPGTVVEINVAEGDRVEPGQQLCVLEAMKMNNPIRATQSGTIKQITMSIGQQVQHGAVLLVID